MQHVGIFRHSAELDLACPLRLTHRTPIKDTVRAVVLQPQADAQTVVDAALPVDLPEAERQALRALISASMKPCRRVMGGTPASPRHGRKRKVRGFDSC